MRNVHVSHKGEWLAVWKLKQYLVTVIAAEVNVVVSFVDKRSRVTTGNSRERLGEGTAGVLGGSFWPRPFRPGDRRRPTVESEFKDIKCILRQVIKRPATFFCQ